MAERVEWLSYCETLGLCMESLECGTLEYCTPFFEFNAQRHAEVQVNAFWRRGDFLTFAKLEDRNVLRPTDDKNDRDGWREVEINEVRIRVDTSTVDEEGDLEIESIIAADVLPSVSSRDERRKLANVWTSGNRIFHTNKPARLFSLPNLMKEEVDDSSTDLETCKERFSVVLELEKKEYDQYVKWFYNSVEGDFTQVL
ncbi:MAG: hypothetical protein JST27_12415 [Bacteroidetes bacterium]|nr:hypothetical protein [Bacteroidota bacterium]